MRNGRREKFKFYRLILNTAFQEIFMEGGFKGLLLETGMYIMNRIREK